MPSLAVRKRYFVIFIDLNLQSLNYFNKTADFLAKRKSYNLLTISTRQQIFWQRGNHSLHVDELVSIIPMFLSSDRPCFFMSYLSTVTLKTSLRINHVYLYKTLMSHKHFVSC